MAGDGGPEQGGGLAAHPQRGRPSAGGRRRPRGGADPQAEAERPGVGGPAVGRGGGAGRADRTLFLRYYYYGDKLKDIARALGPGPRPPPSSGLFRGRKALRDTLTKGGVEA